MEHLTVRPTRATGTGNDIGLRRYLETAATLSLQAALAGLSTSGSALPIASRTPGSEYSFHRISPLGNNTLSESGIWPPMSFPAKDRTTRSSQQLSPAERLEYSCSLFGVKKIDVGLDHFTGSDVELFSTLDPQLYTPDIEHPLRGVWYRSLGIGFEFLCFTSQVAITSLD